MARTRKKIITDAIKKDPLSANIFFGTLMLFYGLQWIIHMHDRGAFVRLSFDVSHLDLFSAITMIAMTAPYLMLSLILANMDSPKSVYIIYAISWLIILLSGTYCAAVFMKAGFQLKWTDLLSKMPFVVYGLFVLIQFFRIRE